MPYSYDPRETEPASAAGQSASNTGSFPTSSQKISAHPGSAPPQNQLPGMRPVKRPRLQRLKTRRTWYIVCGIVLLGVVLGFVFAGPLRPGQNGSPVPTQGSSSIVTSGQPGTAGLTPTGSPFTPGSYDSVNSRLFSNSSPWNLPIGKNVQLDPNSKNWVNQVSDCCHVPTIFQFGMPIYTSTASDPTYTVRDTGNDNAFEANQPIHIPDSAAPSPGSDHWLFIYDKTKNMIFEMWNTSKNGGTWTTQTGNVYNPTGDGVLQVDGSQQEGNGASYFGGVITDADIARGSINHALSFAIQNSSSSWRFPMNASDGHGGSDAVPMGARLQLDPSFDCNTLPNKQVGEKLVCQALETYGGYVRDSGGVSLSMYFEGEDLKDPNRNPPDGSPGNPGRKGGIFNTVGLHDGQDLSDIPWNKLRVLKSWNSFTALGNTPASGSPALSALPHVQLTGFTSAHLSNEAGLTPGEEAKRYRQAA